MIIYTIALEGDYITFIGAAGTTIAGDKRSHRKASVKEIVTETGDDNLTLVSIDNDTTSYDYSEVENPSTSDVAFVDLATFRTYMMTNLAA